MGFEGIVGHELARRRLERTIRTGQAANSYIFTGPAGVGKKTLLDRFAAGLLCTDAEDRPCGRCAACVKYATRNHPDVVYLKPQKDRKSISVDVVRDTVAQEVYVRPLLGQRKLFIVYDGSLLGTAAQNALLKVLEEPPAYATFLLAAHDETAFLPTILSRSQVIALHPLARSEVERYVAGRFGTDNAALYASFAEGSIGRTVAIAEDETFVEVRGEVNGHLKALATGGSAALQAFIQYAAALRDERLDLLLEFMVVWFRDVLLMKIGRKEDVINGDMLYELSLFGDVCPKRAAVDAVEQLLVLKRQLAANAGVGMAVSNTLLKIWEELHEKGNWRTV